MRMPSPRIALVALLCAALSLVAAPPGATAARHHRVRSGQTLRQIARRYRVSVRELQAANALRGSRIRAGQVLTIPTAGEAYVAPGESLARVARRYGVSEAELRRANRLRRGQRLHPGQKLRLPGFEAASAERDWGAPDHPGQVALARHGREERTTQLLTGTSISRLGLRSLEEMLRRDDRDAERHTSPRLALLLARLSDHFGGREMTIVSGFREPRRFTRETSQHVVGVASDIRIHGVPNRTLWEYCRRFDAVGCGFYPRSSFVHVDARDERAHWVDWSRPGRRPRYGTLRGPSRRGRPHLSMPRVEEQLPMDVPIVEDDPLYVAPSPGAPSADSGAGSDTSGG